MKVGILKDTADGFRLRIDGYHDVEFGPRVGKLADVPPADYARDRAAAYTTKKPEEIELTEIVVVGKVEYFAGDDPKTEEKPTP